MLQAARRVIGQAACRRTLGQLRQLPQQRCITPQKLTQIDT